MRAERPRAARYPFVANLTLTDLESGYKTTEKTWDLSLFGCHVVPGGVSPKGTRVRLQITHNGEVFVEDHYQLVLEKWLTELRTKQH